MRNLPEEKRMEEMRKRLANYSEEPDEEDWDKIAAAIPRSTSWWNWKYASVILLLLLYGGLMWLGGWYSHNEVPALISTVEMQSNPPVEADSCQTAAEIIQDDPGWADNNRKPHKEEVNSLPVDQVHIVLEAVQLQGERKVQQNEMGSLIVSDDVASSFHENRPITENEQMAIVEDDPKKDSLAKVALNAEANSQEEKKEERKKKKSRTPVIYFSLTSSLTYHKIIPFRDDNVMITGLVAKGIFSPDRIGFAMDAGGQWGIAKGTELYAGASYYQQNASVAYAFQSSSVKDIQLTDTDFSYVLTPGATSEVFSYKMKNIGMAAGILYHLHGDVLQHKIGGGMQYQIGLLSAAPENSYENKGSGYLNYQVHYRLEFAGRAQYRFYLQPTFTHVIWSHENQDLPFEVKPYRAGIGFGILKSF